MKIAFDGHLFLDNRKTGIAQLGYNLITHLDRSTDNSYTVNVMIGRHGIRNSEVVNDLKAEGLKIKKVFFPGRIYRLISAFFPMPYHMLFGKDTDVTIFFNYVVPPGVAGKKIVFIHDMTYKAFPETMAFKTRELLEQTMIDSVKRADHIITISEFSKKEIMKYLSVPEDMISVLYCGVDEKAFLPKNGKDNLDGEILSKYGLNAPYILYLGTIEPRKNLPRLIKSYNRLKAEQKDTPQLILAGGDGWGYEEVHKLVDELGLKDDVRFLGFVDDDDRPALLRGANFFVFPSLYEGFGMPPLEAMSCGTPVLTADAASLPEVVGDAAVLVDPLNEDSIYAGLKKLCEDKSLRQDLSQKGIIQAKSFSWDKAAKEFKDIIESEVA